MSFIYEKNERSLEIFFHNAKHKRRALPFKVQYMLPPLTYIQNIQSGLLPCLVADKKLKTNPVRSGRIPHCDVRATCKSVLVCMSFFFM